MNLTKGNLRLRTIILVFMLMIVNIAIAQQLPVFTNSLMSQQYNNPAYMVISSVKRMSINYSLAAAGFSDSPKSYILSYENPIVKANSQHLPSYIMGNGSASQGVKNAFGAYMMYDSYGAISQLSTMLSYAQRFKLSEDAFIAFGLSTGIYSYKIDYSKLTIKEQSDNTYAEFQNNNSNLLYWDANFGFLGKYKNYRLGFSIKQFLNNKAKLSNTDISADINPTYYSTISALYDFNSNVSIIPSIEFIKTNSLPYQLNVRAPFIINSKWLASVNYQHNRNIGVGIGFIYNFLLINYSFNYNTNQYSVIGNTNHELGILFLFNRNRQMSFIDFF
jgi:type IX secretion system PorP/SprF family membrane protein